MSRDNVEPYRRYLIRLPWLKQGMFTPVGVNRAYSRIRERFEHAGFHIAANDDRLMRFCAYRDRKEGECTCLHVVWVRLSGHSTYISYGVDPRYFFFWFCRRGDHLEKLRRCGQVIRAALEAD